MSSFCSNCGHLMSGESFCGECGTRKEIAAIIAVTVDPVKPILEDLQAKGRLCLWL